MEVYHAPSYRDLIIFKDGDKVIYSYASGMFWLQNNNTDHIRKNHSKIITDRDPLYHELFKKYIEALRELQKFIPPELTEKNTF